MGYTDAHCHLGTRRFDTNREEIIKRMLACDVDNAIMICCSDHDLERCLDLRKEHPGFKLAIGIHPQSLEYEDEFISYEGIRNRIIKYQPDMIGEIGLDYHSHRHTRDSQIDIFIKQLKLAQEFDLPVDIHSRKASKDTYDILKAYPVRGIMHSYSGSLEMAELYIKLGYYIAYGASVLFENARRPQEVVSKIPLNKLLLETDAPYQSPIRDHTHEPSDVVDIYRKVSELRNIELSELISATEENFNALFK